jgi:CubicO group peptidase (beta-lactamase class C family)
VEQVTRQKFPNAMKNLVFDPLEMNHTFILHKKSFFERISQSYSAGKVRQVFMNLDLIYGDKNMYTTAKDLFKMSLGTYSPKFLSTKMRKEMFQGYSWEKDGLKNYGLGIRMIEEPNSKLFYHTGWWHGNLGMLAMARKDTLCVISISNIYNRKAQKLKPLIDRLKLI